MFCLYQVMHRVSSSRFRASESTLAREFGLDPKTVRASLAALERVNLLRKTPGKSAGLPSEIWLTNPETGAPFPEPTDRHIPTFRSFSKSERTLTTAETKTTGTVASGRAEKMQPLQSPQRREKPRPSSPIEKPTSSVSADAPGREVVCTIPSHSQIHYRADGSPLCGDCHPTGITEPPPKEPFQPTGRQLFGSEDFSPGANFP
jgi:hypothetical protein